MTKFMYEADDVLVDYLAHGNPKSNEDLKRYLRRYPQLREEIVDFTAYWRALSILEKVLPPPKSLEGVLTFDLAQDGRE